jgi:multidrug efflux pump subunit AcrA (membrane-fusion protein)
VDSPAKVTLSERPDLKVEAKVSRVSGELDSKTKMLLSEIDVDNTKGEVVPGSFVNVSIDIHAPAALQLPVQALVMQQGKPTVPVLEGDDRLHFKDVVVGDNSGQVVDVISGLTESDRVVLNAGTNIPENSHVRPIEEKEPEKEKAQK